MTSTSSVTSKTNPQKFSYINGVSDNYVYLAGGGAAMAALCGILTYKNSGESSGKLFGLLSLASLAGVIPAVCCWFNPYNAKSKEAEEFEKVRKGDMTLETEKVNIDINSKSNEKALGSIPLEMWDPAVHGEGYLCRWHGLCDGLKVKDHNEFNEKLNSLKTQADDVTKNILASHSEDIVDVLLEHSKYKAKVKDHEIEILIPAIYADHRAEAVKKYLNSIEKSLSVMPVSLLKLVKKIQFHLGDDHVGNNPNRCSGLSASEDGSINIYLKKFNFKDPTAELLGDEIKMEKQLIELLSLDNSELQIGHHNTSKCALHHEVGHLLQYFIRNNCTGAVIPKEIFLEDSELKNKDLTITESFASSAIPTEVVFQDTSKLKRKALLWAYDQFPDEKDEQKLAAKLKQKVIDHLSANDPNFNQEVLGSDPNDSWYKMAAADKMHGSVRSIERGESFAEAVAGFFKDDTKSFQEVLPNQYAFLIHALKWLEDISKSQNNS